MGLSEFVGNVCTVGVHVLISRAASLTAHGADRLNPLVLNLNSTDHVETGTCGMCMCRAEHVITIVLSAVQNT